VNRSRKKNKPDARLLKLWTHPQAEKALPYVASIVRSLRETRLEALRHHFLGNRLASKPGRPSRKTLIAHEDAIRDADKAEGEFQTALEELQAIDVYCLDPIRGQALIPFAEGDQLAWFVYDLFDQEPLRFWRLHTDPFEERRPISESKACQDPESAVA
jgi:hypothetical protein